MKKGLGSSAFGVWIVLLFINGCSDQYTIDRPGSWQPTGSNDYNLRAMVANPSDLVRGQSAEGDRADLAAPPVHRLLTGHRPGLPKVSSETSK